MKGRIVSAVLLAVMLCCLALGAQCSTFYVTTTGNNNNDGLSWANAKLTIQAALTAASSGDEVWVKAGTYAESITLKSGAGLYGGFAGTESLREDRDWVTNVTTIDGTSSTVNVPSGCATSTIIDGFTITGGSYYVGGGINCSGPATISHNIIRDNQATYNGGGINCSADAKILNNLIKGNSSGYDGAAIYCSGAAPLIANNTIVGHTVNSNGVIYCSNTCTATISSNIVANNTKGIYVATGGSTPTLRYNDFYNTTANYTNISAGTGDLQMDPVFADYSNGDYHLLFGSPCIDTGYDSDVIQDKDLDGNSRQVDILTVGSSSVDMGAYEFDDPTPPTAPVVTDDGDYTISLTSLHASWTSSESESGIAEYQYAIGTTQGGTDVKSWTTVQTMGATATGLSLSHGQTYYFSVNAKNSASVWSSAGYSDGITCVSPGITVASTSSAVNRKVAGAHHYDVGTEYWNWSSQALASGYETLLNKWQLGTVRSSANQRSAWDADKTPYFKDWHDSFIYDMQNDIPWDAPAYLDDSGHILGANGMIDIAAETNATLSWVVNMNGNLDSYGRAVDEDGTGSSTQLIQGAYSPGVTPGFGAPSANEKENWFTPYDENNLGNGYAYSIYKSAEDLASTIAASGVDAVFELGNEVYYGCSIPEAYWKTSSSQDRITWGGGWGNYEKLADYYYHQELDWNSSNKTGTTGNVIYLGFPYKPWSLTFSLLTAGAGGSASWQYYGSDSNWHTLAPTGVFSSDTVDFAHGGVNTPREVAVSGSTLYSDVTNLKYGPKVVDNVTLYRDCTIFFLPLPDTINEATGQPTGYDESDWEQSGDHLSGWVRTQPSELSGERKLYWLRVCADSTYTTSPVIKAMKSYFPDQQDYLATCSEMCSAIKQRGDSNAKVYIPGIYPTHGNYLPACEYTNRFIWHYITDSRYSGIWDGIVIHPYIWDIATNTELLDMVDTPDLAGIWNCMPGLLRQINDMQTLLTNKGLGSKSIACTEWGWEGDTAMCKNLAMGLYCLDGTLAMMRNCPADYAAWHGAFPPQSNHYSFFYTNPSMSTTVKAQLDLELSPAYPTPETSYVQRPTGLAMELVGSFCRAYGHDVTDNLDTSDGKVYAFSESEENNTLILINKKNTQQTYTLSWPAVAGKKIYAICLKSNQTTPSLDDNNEVPSAKNVELTAESCLGTVSADGTFRLTNISAYSAIGIEFKDN